jgi:hypothetical protein
MSKSNPDRVIEERSIKIGPRSDETDIDRRGGDSATRQTTVYPVTVSSVTSSYTLRLIDTPGIGDTRGEDDEKNISDILSTLRNFDDVHGIPILLKSDAAGLTKTFQYLR